MTPPTGGSGTSVEARAGRLLEVASQLCTEELTSTNAPAFAALYELYAKLFPLPDEREPPEAFANILAMNERLDIQQKFSPWREIVAVVRAWAGGPVVGGHVFGMTTSRAHVEFWCRASVQGIYTFLDALVRGRLSMAAIKRYFQAQALSVFDYGPGAPRRPPLIFLEVNNPLRMSADEIAADAASAGIDPHRRYVFWKRSGFRPLDFPYVQPRLRDDAQPVRYLDLFCTSDVDTVPSRLIANHLRAFVAISVLKGRPAEGDPDFAAMQARLQACDTVGFVPDHHPDQQAIRRRARELTRGTNEDRPGR